jgi:hypothetical protein
MECSNILITEHLLIRLAERNILYSEALQVLEYGEELAFYENDKPFASRLLFKFVNGRPLHIVASKDDITDTCYLITAYEPDEELWQSDFKTRKK